MSGWAGGWGMGVGQPAVDILIDLRIYRSDVFMLLIDRLIISVSTDVDTSGCCLAATLRVGRG